MKKVRKIFGIIIFLGALALISCGKEDTVTVDFPFKDCSFGLMVESISEEDETTAVKLEREYSFTDSDFLPQLEPYKQEPSLTLDISDKSFRVTRRVGDAESIDDIVLIASIDGAEIARWEYETLAFSTPVTDEAYEAFVDTFFKAVVDDRKTVNVVFTGTLFDYVVTEANREKVQVTYDFLQQMLANVTIKR